MNDKKEIFADGIGQIHFAGGMVRYDFVTLQPEEDGKAPAREGTPEVGGEPPALDPRGTQGGAELARVHRGGADPPREPVERLKSCEIGFAAVDAAAPRQLDLPREDHRHHELGGDGEDIGAAGAVGRAEAGDGVLHPVDLPACAVDGLADVKKEMQKLGKLRLSACCHSSILIRLIAYCNTPTNACQGRRKICFRLAFSAGRWYTEGVFNCQIWLNRFRIYSKWSK